MNGSDFFISRPFSRPGGIARQTPTETDFCLKGMRLLPGPVGRTKVLCLRQVCANLRLTDIIVSNRKESSARK
jgi:hypothetical protein